MPMQCLKIHLEPFALRHSPVIIIPHVEIRGKKTRPDFSVYFRRLAKGERKRARLQTVPICAILENEKSDGKLVSRSGGKRIFDGSQKGRADIFDGGRHGEQIEVKRNEGIRENNVRRATEYLLNQLLPLPCGSRLPGIRTIVERTGLGKRTVCHAIRDLARRGFLQVRPDRGIFRTKPDEKSDEIRLLHWSMGDIEEYPFVRALFGTLTELAAMEGRLLTVENVCRRSWEKIDEELTSHGISRVIIYSAMIPDFAEYLRKRMDVCMELLPRHTEQVAVELRISPELVRIQLSYLFNLGYRRIGYLHYGGGNPCQYPIHTMRLLDYYRIMAEQGILVDPSWVLQCRGRNENLEAGLEKMWDSGSRPEALIAWDGDDLTLISSWCRKRRIRIGKDLAIFCGDDVAQDRFPEVTAITNNPAEIAQTFWRMFLAVERGEKVESCHTELMIRVGQTVPNKKPL